MKNTGSTRGQHHLPQFLLKGFASRSPKKEVFTWLFRHDGTAAEANVKGIAKARDFYGNPNSSNIEQRLSELEGSFANLVRRLRSGEALQEKRSICEFVANTQVRTANLRAGVSEALKDFTDDFGATLTTPQVRNRLAEHALTAIARRFGAGEFDDVLSLLTPSQKALYFELLKERLPGYLDSALAETTDQFRKHMPSLTEPKNFRDSQNKILSDNLVPKKRVEQLMELEWKVLVCDDETLILGDVGTLAGSPLGGLMNVVVHDPVLDSVYLPIAYNRLLLGRRTNVVIASVKELNLASSELSRDFFVSHSKDGREDLRARLRMRRKLISDVEMGEIVSSAFVNFESVS